VTHESDPQRTPEKKPFEVYNALLNKQLPGFLYKVLRAERCLTLTFS